MSYTLHFYSQITFVGFLLLSLNSCVILMKFLVSLKPFKILQVRMTVPMLWGCLGERVFKVSVST